MRWANSVNDLAKFQRILPTNSTWCDGRALVRNPIWDRKTGGASNANKIMRRLTAFCFPFCYLNSRKKMKRKKAVDDCPLKINNHLKCYLVASNIHARNGNVQLLFREFRVHVNSFLLFASARSCSSAPSRWKTHRFCHFENHKIMRIGTASIEIRINFHFVVKRENWTRKGIRNKNKKWNFQTYRSVRLYVEHSQFRFCEWVSARMCACEPDRGPNVQ